MKHFLVTYIVLLFSPLNLQAATPENDPPGRCALFSVEAANLLADAGINAANLDNMLANFETESPSRKRAVEMVQQLIGHSGPDSIGLFLTGVGKTHLAVAAVREALERNMNVVLVTPYNLARIWTKLHQASSSKEELISECDFIILDDFDVKGGGPFAANFFEEVLAVARRLGGKKILVTSNLDMSHLIEAFPDLNDAERSRMRRHVESIFQTHRIDNDQNQKANWFKESPDHQI